MAAAALGSLLSGPSLLADAARFQPADYKELVEAVGEWFQKRGSARQDFGEIGSWDISRIYVLWVGPPQPVPRPALPSSRRETPSEPRLPILHSNGIFFFE